MLVADLPGLQRLLECFPIELRGGPRPGDRPNVDNEVGARLPQEIGKLDDRPG